MPHARVCAAPTGAAPPPLTRLICTRGFRCGFALSWRPLLVERWCSFSAFAYIEIAALCARTHGSSKRRRKNDSSSRAPKSFTKCITPGRRTAEVKPCLHLTHRAAHRSAVPHKKRLPVHKRRAHR
ncbi:hypothetical protein, conserved [Leishmania tarentolae]|uniref:Uncharacterized protein n=1 Tax=Leishmania tarentolae TaxID=5689 RepID=A0A640KIQ5_LEITA|nr:hypothetical protein, conserved [Leishmania tarentolae]